MPRKSQGEDCKGMSTHKGVEEAELMGKPTLKSAKEAGTTKERGQSFGGQGVTEEKGPSDKGVIEVMRSGG